MDVTELPVCDVRLPPDEVTRILDRLDTAESASDDCQRRSERHRLRGLAVVVLIFANGVPEATVRVRLRNVSRHGVAFLSARPIMMGTPLRIFLPLGPEGESVRREAVAARCRLVERGLHEIGAEFFRWSGGLYE